MYILQRLWGKVHFLIAIHFFYCSSLAGQQFILSLLTTLLTSSNPLPSALLALISCHLSSVILNSILFFHYCPPKLPTNCTPSQLFLIILPCCYDCPLPLPTNCTPFICLCRPCHCQSWLFSNHPLMSLVPWYGSIFAFLVFLLQCWLTMMHGINAMPYASCANLCDCLCSMLNFH